MLKNERAIGKEARSCKWLFAHHAETDVKSSRARAFLMCLAVTAATARAVASGPRRERTLHRLVRVGLPRVCDNHRLKCHAMFPIISGYL